MQCENKNCTRSATVSNSQYFKGVWYCTFHANKATKEGRRKKNNKLKTNNNVKDQNN
jgi:hypothetical protein